MKRRLDRRGSVLLLVVVLLAVISLLAAAAVAFSHSELGAARNDRSGDELLACADAGRQYMLSRFSLTGVPMDLSAVNKDVNSAGIVDCKSSGAQAEQHERCVRSGHIGQVSVSGITQVKAKAGGDRKNLRDLTNTVGDPVLGGSPYKVLVHCVDDTGRGTEVEFVVRYGL
jgi:hypothetical protein